MYMDRGLSARGQDITTRNLRVQDEIAYCNVSTDNFLVVNSECWSDRLRN